MKTLTKMFLLCCWVLFAFSFAKESVEQIEANEIQQTIQEKEAALEALNAEPAKVPIEERALIPVNTNNLEAEKVAAEEAAARKAAAIQEKLNNGILEVQVEEAVVNPPKATAPNSLPRDIFFKFLAFLAALYKFLPSLPDALIYFFFL